MSKANIIPYKTYSALKQDENLLQRDEAQAFKKVKVNTRDEQIILTPLQLEQIKQEAYRDGVRIGQNELEMAMKLAEETNLAAIQNYKDNISDNLSREIFVAIDRCFEDLQQKLEQKLAQLFCHVFEPRETELFLNELKRALEKLQSNQDIELIVSCSQQDVEKIEELIAMLCEKNPKILTSLKLNETNNIEVKVNKTIFSSTIDQWREFMASKENCDG